MGRGTRSAPYFVTMREGERRMLIAAIESCGSIEAAAAALGVTKEYVRSRALHLGGVLPEQAPAEAAPKAKPNVRAEAHTPKRKYTRKPKLSLVPAEPVQEELSIDE